MSKKPVIGLLGGGQLGRMLCEAASPLGIEIAVLDEPGCPAKQVNASSRHVAGSFKDPDKIRQLARRCDVLTVEIEHVDAAVLEEIETRGVTMLEADGSSRVKKVPVHPSWRTLRLIQDKFRQKELFRERGIPVAEQVPVASGGDMLASLHAVGARFGFPFYLKSRRDSYDGRGNFRVESPESFAAATAQMDGLDLYAERVVPFAKELAVMVIRTESGGRHATVAYPAVETVHEDSICTRVYMPPPNVSEEACQRARDVACAVVDVLWGRGVFAVELFLLRDGSILVNEVAPRPHNSGHYTIEAVPQMSQFKAQLYAIFDMLPASLDLKPRAASAIMVNILGGSEPASHGQLVSLAEGLFAPGKDTYLHLYGKTSKPGRKIGHITTTGACSLIELELFTQPLVVEFANVRQERFAKGALLEHQGQDPTTPKTAGGTEEKKKKQKRRQPLVLVTMGSDSDLPVLRAGLDVLKEFDVPFEVNITSAHRTPNYMARVAEGAAARGLEVIIAAAGGAAHLPGMVASHTPLPVIGVPVKATHLDGQDSLLSIVQMPRGVPCATVGINNSTNAALLAVRILGCSRPEYQERMAAYQKGMEEQVLAKAESLKELGYELYLDQKGKS